MRPHLVAYLAFVLALPSQADSPPPWQPFKTVSSNGAYTAEVFFEAAGQSLPPYERNWRLRVLEAARGNALWETAYKFDGYRGGALSDDGQYFAYVNFWYYEDAPVVTVYQERGTSRFAGRELQVDPASLQSTASHKLWLDGSSHFTAGRGGVKCLVVGTIQGLRAIALGPNPAFQQTASGIC